MKAVLFEDNDVDSRLLRELFAIHGHHMMTLSTPVGALEQIAAEQPDIVLVDLSLPAMSGLALVRDLRRFPATAALRVVAVTAYPARYTNREIQESGCNAWLVKPLDTRTVLAQLAQPCID
jgi:CheY-like chemotaxis protein